MKTKTCTKCDIEKDISEFVKHSWCQKCLKESRKQHYLKNKEKLKAKSSQYYKENKKKTLQRQKKYKDKHKEKLRIQKKQHYEENKEHFQRKARKHHKNNLEYYKNYMKYYRDNNKEKIAKYDKEYRINRMKNDISFKLLCNLRSRIIKALKGKNKSLSTMMLIGCEIDYLMYHIQEQFTNGMSWDNHGRGWNGAKEWHIDHKLPCASFDLSILSEQRKCFHFSNLQPLWAIDNLKKGSK